MCHLPVEHTCQQKILELLVLVYLAYNMQNIPWHKDFRLTALGALGGARDKCESREETRLYSYTHTSVS